MHIIFEQRVRNTRLLILVIHFLSFFLFFGSHITFLVIYASVLSFLSFDLIFFLHSTRKWIRKIRVARLRHYIVAIFSFNRNVFQNQFNFIEWRFSLVCRSKNEVHYLRSAMLMGCDDKEMCETEAETGTRIWMILACAWCMVCAVRVAAHQNASYSHYIRRKSYDLNCQRNR